MDILWEADEKLRMQVAFNERRGMLNRGINEECVKERVNEQELRRGGQRMAVSLVKARVAYILSLE